MLLKWDGNPEIGAHVWSYPMAISYVQGYSLDQQQSQIWDENKENYYFP